MGANSFADEARAKKVKALIRYMDRRFTGLGFNVYTQADEIAVMLRDKVSEDEWKRHAVLAGVKKPSADSIAMVIKEFEDRAAAGSAGEETFLRFGGLN